MRTCRQTCAGHVHQQHSCVGPIFLTKPPGMANMGKAASGKSAFFSHSHKASESSELDSLE